jgi:hypothetical protein
MGISFLCNLCNLWLNYSSGAWYGGLVRGRMVWIVR